MHPILLEYQVNDLHARRAAEARRDIRRPFSLRGLSRIKALVTAMMPIDLATPVDTGPKLDFSKGYPWA